jgi:hypothetical protein
MTGSLGLLTVVACGGDDDGGASPNPTPDGGVLDTGGDTTVTPDTDTDTGGGVPCTRTRDCTEAGLVGAVCNPNTGFCEVSDTGPPVASCLRALAECTSADQSTDSFLCDPELGLCLPRCSDALTESRRGRNCPPNTNTYCFEINDPDPPRDPNSGDILNGVCIPGDCTSQFNADGSVNFGVCDGQAPVLAANRNCGTGGCSCIPFGNGASFCVPVGDKAQGESCGSTNTDLCAAGLNCFRGTCVQPCQVGNASSCSGGTDSTFCPEGGTCRCVEVLDTTTANRPGICGVGCDPFSADQCPGATTCTPVWGRFGVNNWFCSPVQATPVAAGGACDPAAGNFGQCAEGAICVAETEGGPGRCTPLCDPRGQASGALASCAAAPGATLVASTGYRSASDYVVADAGTVDAEIRRADNGSLVRPISLTLTDGVATSAIAAINDAGALTVFTVVDNEGTLPATGFRAIHAAANAGDVDVYLGTLYGPVATSSAARFSGLTAGAWNLTLATGGTELFDGAFAAELSDGTLYTAVAWLNGADASLGLFAAANAGAPTTGLRFLHAVNGAPAVDIYVAGEDDPVITGLAFGEATAMNGWTGLPAAGEISVYATGDTESALVTIPWPGDASYLTVVLAGANLGSAAVFSEAGLAAADAPTLQLFHTIGAVGPVDLIAESQTPLAEGVSFEGVLAADDASFLAIAAGTYFVNLRAAGDEPTDDPILASDALTISTGLTTVIIAGDAEAELDVIVIDETLPTLAAGEGAIRLVHAASSAPAVTIQAVGESSNVCAPITITGLGFCNEGCAPFPRRPGAYGCSEPSDSCAPFVPRNDRAVLPLGQCVGDDGTLAPGQSCPEPGRLGGGCRDLAACLGETAEATTGTCFELCENFSSEENVCGAGRTCDGIRPLTGVLAFSFCLEAPAGNSGVAGDRCNTVGQICAGDGTICLTADQAGTSRCFDVCRSGFPDCTTGTCRTGVFPESVVPAFMGICL